MPLMYPLVFAAFLFSIGVYGVLARRNAVMVLMSIELMLNAVNINLIAFNAYLRDQLAIVLLIFRNRETVNIDEVDLLRW
jgi:NADH-quinone oxidoreductase subunit K